MLTVLHTLLWGRIGCEYNISALIDVLFVWHQISDILKPWYLPSEYAIFLNMTSTMAVVLNVLQL